MNITPYEQNFGAGYRAAMTSLGQAMARIITHFGARTIYGVGGDFAANLIAALDGGTLEVLPSSNEMHAGFCACAQAEVDGIGFCLTTYTVGSLPCMSAAALAKTEGLAVVFISGAPGEDEVHQAGLHHMVQPANSWRDDYDAALKAFAALGLRSERLQGDRARGQPNIAAFRFFELVRHAWLHREPVFVEVPRNLVAALTQPLTLPPLAQLLARDMVFAGIDSVIDTIVSHLRAARAPLLYVGEQVKRNPLLRRQVQEFCRRQQIAYASNWFAKGIFDERDGLCLGAYNGVFSAAQARVHIEQHVDYVLDLGTSVIAQDTGSAFHTGTHRIQSFSNRTVVKSTVAHEADLVRILEALLAAELPHFAPPAALPAEELPAADTAMDFDVLAQTLNALGATQDYGTVFVPEVGNSFFASFGLRPRATDLGINWLGNPWYAAMGTALPYARVVAQTIARERHTDRTVVITGDGGFHFQLNELIHCLKQDLALTIIYLRNDIFSLGKSGDGPIYHCSTPRFDVHALIRAYGGLSCRCATVGEFADRYRAWLDANRGIRLIEVPCSDDESRQCRELRLLNLCIRARNGDATAQQAWRRQCDTPAP